MNSRLDAVCVQAEDPEGNALCVIEPGNSFLAGCGFLGELACDGSPAVGRFWSGALDWPLGWDQDQETAIQSRHGAAPRSRGQAPPVTPAKDRGSLHFDLTPPGSTDFETEVERLVSLGATQGETDASGPGPSSPTPTVMRSGSGAPGTPPPLGGEGCRAIAGSVLLEPRQDGEHPPMAV
jgi:hypothetical protein